MNPFISKLQPLPIAQKTILRDLIVATNAILDDIGKDDESPHARSASTCYAYEAGIIWCSSNDIFLTVRVDGWSPTDDGYKALIRKKLVERGWGVVDVVVEW